MKKTILIIFTVAILGTIGVYAAGNPNQTSGLVSNPANSTASNQTASSASPSSNNSGSSAGTPSKTYKDGTFTASSNTPYGTVEIGVVINGGKITDVKFLQMPSDQGHSREVTAYAQPLLKQTTLQSQSSNIDFVSGATSTSYGYEQSLQQALDQAVQA